MAKKKARACFKILRRGNPERTMTVTGKTFKDAQRAGRALLRRMRIGDAAKSIGRKARVLVGGKKRKKAKNARKRKPLSFGQRMARLRKKKARARRR